MVEEGGCVCRDEMRATATDQENVRSFDTWEVFLGDGDRVVWRSTGDAFVLKWM